MLRTLLVTSLVALVSASNATTADPGTATTTQSAGAGASNATATTTTQGAAATTTTQGPVATTTTVNAGNAQATTTTVAPTAAANATTATTTTTGASDLAVLVGSAETQITITDGEQAAFKADPVVRTSAAKAIADQVTGLTYTSVSITDITFSLRRNRQLSSVTTKVKFHYKIVAPTGVTAALISSGLTAVTGSNNNFATSLSTEMTSASVGFNFTVVATYTVIAAAPDAGTVAIMSTGTWELNYYTDAGCDTTHGSAVDGTAAIGTACASMSILNPGASLALTASGSAKVASCTEDLNTAVSFFTDASCATATAPATADLQEGACTKHSTTGLYYRLRCAGAAAAAASNAMTAGIGALASVAAFLLM